MKILMIALAALLARPASTAVDHVALVGGTVWTGTRGAQVARATVVLRDGKIVSVLPDTAPIPRGATTIDVRGKFIMPGLVDAHVHFFQSGGLYTRPDALDLRKVRSYQAELKAIKESLPETFARYLALGITAVVDVGGPMWNFEVRTQAAREPAAPRVAVAGPLISTVNREKLDLGDPPIIGVSSPDEARALVRRELAHKPDLMKVWYIVRKPGDVIANRPILAAVVRESRKAGVRVAVHATQLEAARAAVEDGADVLVHSVDNRELDQSFIDLLKRNKTILCPTLGVYLGYSRVFSGTAKPSAWEQTWGDAEAIQSWGDLSYIQPLSPPAPSAQGELMARNLARLSAAGVTIAAGSDAGNIGTLHGTGFHHELELMEAAGLSRDKILIAATRDAARVFADPAPFGTIEPGKEANLLILDKNPLDSLQNLKAISRVIKGRWMFEPRSLVPPSPESVVARQVEAYNAHDLDAFLATYHADATIMEHDGKVRMKGQKAMRARYGELFKKHPEVVAHIVSRTAGGPFVVDREIAQTSDATHDVIVVYEVRDGKIVTVRFFK